MEKHIHWNQMDHFANARAHSNYLHWLGLLHGTIGFALPSYYLRPLLWWKNVFVWLIRNSWEKLLFVCASLLMLCSSNQGKAEAPEWCYKDHANSVPSCLCFDHQGKTHCNLRIARRMGSRDYTIARSWHLYLWKEGKLFRKFTCIFLKNEFSINEPPNT